MLIVLRVCLRSFCVRGGRSYRTAGGVPPLNSGRRTPIVPRNMALTTKISALTCSTKRYGWVIKGPLPAVMSAPVQYGKWVIAVVVLSLGQASLAPSKSDGRPITVVSVE